MDSHDELVFRLGESGGVGCRVVGGQGPGILGGIPCVLLLESQGSGRSVREQAIQEPFQELSEKGMTSVLVQLEQPANYGDKEHLDGLGINLMGQILHFLTQAGIEILQGESYPIKMLMYIVYSLSGS